MRRSSSPISDSQKSQAARLTQRLKLDEAGAVTVPFSLTLVLLCLFVGAGIDIGRWVSARNSALAALDAAVLAGGRSLQLNSTDVASAIETAKKVYKENIERGLTLVDDTVSFEAGDGHTTFRSTGNAYIKTPLLSLAAIDKLPVLSENGAEYSQVNLSGGGRGNSNPVEISMMLDVTGSMEGTKASDMKTAASDLINIVISDTGQGSTKMALVPFSAGVRLPASANTAARGTPASSVKVSGTRYYPTDCVVERTGSERYTDAAPGSGTYVMTRFDSYRYCPLGATEELLPLTSNKSALLARVQGLNVSDATAGHLGTAWAWYTLSPNWNSLWPSSGATAYGSDVKKIAVLMTDGEYNTQFDTRGINTNDSRKSPANDTSNNQALALCSAMKAKGIEVYTVGFALGNNATAISTLQTCATDSTKFYRAENGEALKQAFRDIALKISVLYLSK